MPETKVPPMPVDTNGQMRKALTKIRNGLLMVYVVSIGWVRPAWFAPGGFDGPHPVPPLPPKPLALPRVFRATLISTGTAFVGAVHCGSDKVTGWYDDGKVICNHGYRMNEFTDVVFVDGNP